jgi:hypothetical protein
MKYKFEEPELLALGCPKPTEGSTDPAMCVPLRKVEKTASNARTAFIVIGSVVGVALAVGVVGWLMTKKEK